VKLEYKLCSPVDSPTDRGNFSVRHLIAIDAGETVAIGRDGSASIVVHAWSWTPDNLTPEESRFIIDC